MNQRILLVGGAGYIGSHMVALLKDTGFNPVVLDDLSKGHAAAVADVEFIKGDMGDSVLLDELFQRYRFNVVMHFGGFINVAESVQSPLRYYQNNLAKSLILLTKMLEHDCKHIVFSSTAAVYGEPQYTPIDERHVIAPINVYGRTKAMLETIIQDFAHSNGLRYAILRYFNAAGAHPHGKLAEAHSPECHLIPLILNVAKGESDALTIFGNNYATHDGTCIRDYIHVTDLCQAHLLALDYLFVQNENLICNLGNGVGYSVKQVIQAAEQVTGTKINTINGKNRPGDPAILVADASYASKVIGWNPQYSDLSTIIGHAWQTLINIG